MHDFLLSCESHAEHRASRLLVKLNSRPDDGLQRSMTTVHPPILAIYWPSEHYYNALAGPGVFHVQEKENI